MSENREQTAYLFDARRATPDYPETLRYCSSLLPVMAEQLKEGEHLHIVTSDEEFLAGLDSLIKVTLHCIPVNPNSCRSRALLRRILKKAKPALCHSATILDPFPSRMRCIATIHQNCPLNKGASQSSFFERMAFRFLVKPRLKRCETFISISRTLLNTYAGTPVPLRNRIIPYGVNAMFKPCTDDEIEEVRQKYSLPARFLLMIMAGQNTRNMAAVLDAMLTTDFTESAPLVIAGYSSRCDTITKMIEQRKLQSRVLQTGPIDDPDMPALYSAAHVLLFPNIVRGTGLPVVEAMACGTPVICASFPVLSEITGGAAALVHPTDKLEWRRAISTALLSINWRDEFRAAALQRAGSLTWERAARDTLSVYRASS